MNEQWLLASLGVGAVSILFILAIYLWTVASSPDTRTWLRVMLWIGFFIAACLFAGWFAYTSSRIEEGC